MRHAAAEYKNARLELLGWRELRQLLALLPELREQPASTSLAQAGARQPL